MAATNRRATTAVNGLRRGEPTSSPLWVRGRYVDMSGGPLSPPAPDAPRSIQVAHVSVNHGATWASVPSHLVCVVAPPSACQVLSTHTSDVWPPRDPSSIDGAPRLAIFDAKKTVVEVQLCAPPDMATAVRERLAACHRCGSSAHATRACPPPSLGLLVRAAQFVLNP
jgi:hypothetical protein